MKKMRKKRDSEIARRVNSISCFSFCPPSANSETPHPHHHHHHRYHPHRRHRRDSVFDCLFVSPSSSSSPPSSSSSCRRHLFGRYRLLALPPCVPESQMESNQIENLRCNCLSCLTLFLPNCLSCLSVFCQTTSNQEVATLWFGTA